MIINVKGVAKTHLFESQNRLSRNGGFCHVFAGYMRLLCSWERLQVNISAGWWLGWLGWVLGAQRDKAVLLNFSNSPTR